MPSSVIPLLWLISEPGMVGTHSDAINGHRSCGWSQNKRAMHFSMLLSVIPLLWLISQQAR